jgi:hypothetical protein
MVSGKLIHLIEAHQEEITNRVMRAVTHHPDLDQMRKLQELELRERCRQILQQLGHWIAAGKEEELAKQYETIGRTRCEQGIPLHEAVRTLFIIKEKMINFVEEQGINKNSMDIYAEEELARRVDRFFDALVVHLVKGYETALRRAALAAVV